MSKDMIKIKIKKCLCECHKEGWNGKKHHGYYQAKCNCGSTEKNYKDLYKEHLENKVEHIWVETLKCVICGKYHEAYLYEMNPKQYWSIQKELDKLLKKKKSPPDLKEKGL